ncbi:hypothetical protein AGLY_001459 [Aphis glycines]|uniref:Uncharacterized protein n=1 Tax=Aphis glycines TaxID=307491 RepID=A0A6G0U678_APHGL|nr:hypothetical protein AGLY_001459 [Aphis glycines]
MPKSAFVDTCGQFIFVSNAQHNNLRSCAAIRYSLYIVFEQVEITIENTILMDPKTPSFKFFCFYQLQHSERSDEGIDFTMMYVLDSERSDECIDFTMIITSRNNAPISNYGGGFRCKSEYLWCIIQVKIFKKIEKNKKKNDEKGQFLRKTSFRQNRIFYFAITQKLIDVNTLNFHKIQLKFSIFLIVLKVIKKNPKSLVTIFFYKCLKFEFIRNMSKLRKFASNFVVGKSFSINFSSNIYKKNSTGLRQKIFMSIVIFFTVNKIFLAQSKYLKILYKVPHMHIFFLLAFEVQILTKIRQNYEYLQIIFYVEQFGHQMSASH